MCDLRRKFDQRRFHTIAEEIGLRPAPMRRDDQAHAAVVPRSHSWGLDRLPPVIGSASEPQLFSQPLGSKRQTRHHMASGMSMKPKHYGLPKAMTSSMAMMMADPIRSPLAGASEAQAASATSLLDIELRLKEVLSTTPAWPPSRRRVLAALDALREMSRVPSKFSSVLPMLSAEFSTAVTSRHEGGAGGLGNGGD